MNFRNRNGSCPATVYGTCKLEPLSILIMSRTDGKAKAKTAVSQETCRDFFEFQTFEGEVKFRPHRR